MKRITACSSSLPLDVRNFFSILATALVKSTIGVIEDTQWRLALALTIDSLFS